MNTAYFARLRMGFERVLEAIVFVLMIALAAIVTIAVIYRKFGDSLVWYDEIASVMLAWITYYGAALAALKGGHIGVSALVDAMPPKLRLAATLFSEVCVIGFFTLLAWVGYTVLEVLATDTLVSLPDVPVHYTQSVIPIGATLFVIAELLHLPQALREAARRTEVNP